MYFTAKFAGFLFVGAASPVSTQASIIPHIVHAQLSVTFFDNVSYTGEAYSPDVVEAYCVDLPTNWQRKPESVIISPGWECDFPPHLNCEGSPIVTLTGKVERLPGGLCNNVHSFFCTKP